MAKVTVGFLGINVDPTALNWVRSEGKGSGYELVDVQAAPDLDKLHALYCLMLHRTEGYEENVASLRTMALAAQERGLPVVWLVQGEEFPGALHSITDFRKIRDAQPLLDALLAIPESAATKPKPEKDKPDPKKEEKEAAAEPRDDSPAASAPGKLVSRIKFVMPKPQNSGPIGDEDLEDWSMPRVRIGKREEGRIEEEFDPGTLTNVIAVGGPRGCGSSFFAYNAASLLNAYLFDERRSGTLAKWLGADEETYDRLSVLTQAVESRGQEGQRFGVCSVRALTNDDILLIQQIPKAVVVDCGDNYEGIWRFAAKRIFVVTPDPQYQGLDFPKDTIRVMNRYFPDFPTPPEKVFSASIDLVVPDTGRDGLLALWAKRPWISKQSVAVKKTWLDVLER